MLLPLALRGASRVADHCWGVPEAEAEGYVAEVQLADIEDVFDILGG